LVFEQVNKNYQLSVTSIKLKNIIHSKLLIIKLTWFI